MTRAQLLAAGLGADAIDKRVSLGRLHAVHRGVYLLGSRLLAPGAREMAAVLACGPGAVASHRSSAERWRLLPYPAQNRERTVDVTVQRRGPDNKPGIRVHLIHLDPRDARACNRIPVTAPARTLLDLAATRPFREFEQALAEAQARLLVRRRDLMDVLERNAGRRGTRVLRAALEAEAPPALTRSEAEERFLGLVRSAGLPAPETNVRLGPYEVDFLWRAERLIVEVDGFQYHSSRAAFEHDRLRDAELQAHGFRVIRVTWRQIVDEPEALIARVGRTVETANAA